MTNTVSAPKNTESTEVEQQKTSQRHAMVGIAAINMVNNYKCLPDKWEDEENGVSITVLGKPPVEVISSLTKKNVFDITLIPTLVTDVGSCISSDFTGVNGDTIHLYRYPKPIQSLFCIKAHQLIGEKGGSHITVPGFEFNRTHGFKLPYADTKNQPTTTHYLIKPVSGARGIGILTFQAAVHCPKTIGKILDNSVSLGDFKTTIEREWVDSGIVNNVNLASDVFLQSMETLTEEGYQALRDQGFYIQEKIEVYKEWRVIFQICDIEYPLMGYDFYVFNRSRDGKKLDPRNFKHVEEGFDKVIACSETRASVHNYLTTLLRESKQLFGSLDLFEDVNDKYGVFEFSNQFGMEDNNTVFFEKLHKSFIEKIVNAAL